VSMTECVLMASVSTSMARTNVAAIPVSDSLPINRSASVCTLPYVLAALLILFHIASSSSS